MPAYQILLMTVDVRRNQFKYNIHPSIFYWLSLLGSQVKGKNSEGQLSGHNFSSVLLEGGHTSEPEQPNKNQIWTKYDYVLK